MEIDREETARRLGRAFEAAAQKLAEGGVPDAEIGKAMVAIGLSRWSRAVTAEVLTEQLAGLTVAIAESAGIALNKPEEAPIRH